MPLAHALVDIDADARTATCSRCGPTSLLRSSSHAAGWRCRASRNAGDRRAQKHRLRLREYGLVRETWAALLVAQAGRCAICVTPMCEPCVDHCHDTGRVRGLLCRSCNLGIGLLGDDAERLAAAADYLRA